MKIALAQIALKGNIEENFCKNLDYIGTAAEKGADLICFPELQLSPFFPQYPGRDASAYLLNTGSGYIQEICKICRTHHIFAVPNFYIEEDGRCYDMSLLIDNTGEIIGRQKMVHIAQCENFYEQDYYTPSEEGFQVFDTPFGKIGIVVCFDRHYPESIRTEALLGAELIIIPTANTKAEPSEMFQWEIRVQAFQNSVNIAMCNRVGTEGRMEFSGESVIVGYDGEVIACANAEENLLIAEISLTDATKTRQQKPYMKHRRPSLYE